MAYALHRRAAFRQAAIGSGWNFDLTKSEYVNLGSLLSRSGGVELSRPPGYPVAYGRLFLDADSSKLIVQPDSSSSSQRLYRYNFPFGHYGDISSISNVAFSGYSRVLFYERRPCAFSPDGLHYVQQGHSETSSTTTLDGITIGRHDLFSCPLDSSFSIGMPTLFTMARLEELTSNIIGLAFSGDGLYLLMMPNSGSIRSYYLQTPYDVSSASLVYTQVSLSRFGISGVRDWQFSPDGFTLVLLVSAANSNNATFHVFRMSAPFNITTLSHEQTWDSGQNYVLGFTIDRAGQNLYISRTTTILQYALSA